MTSHVKLRKERSGLADYDMQIKEVRLQLVDQLKVLDIQLEQKSQQLLDLTDYLRRRGEIEGEYARSLDKLSERFSAKIKRKDPGGHSVAQVWLTLLTQTRQESREHGGLSESYSNLLIQPLTHCLEYTQRLARKSKDVCSQLQDGLLKVTTELQTGWRTYYQYHSEYMSAEGKLKEAEKMEEKQKQSSIKKVEKLIGKTPRFRFTPEKKALLHATEQRQGKVQEIRLKCTKARNEYLLNLAAANASMNKYYVQDISSIIDCADVGYHLTLGRVMRAYLSSQCRAQQNLDTGLQQLRGTLNGLDEKQDRDHLLQAHNNTFCLPLRFPYLPHDGDQVSEVSAECEMRSDLEKRYEQIQTRLTAVTQETEEAHKGLLTGRAFLLESICDDDLEPSSSAQEGSSENLARRPSVVQRRANLQEAEQIYVTGVKEYLVDSSLVSKLQAKHDMLKVAVEKAVVTKERKPRVTSKSLKRTHSSSTAILFSGDMLSFLKASGQQIPMVVESCIRFINLNGLHHEGIFRVPGSQLDVNSLRDAFERGEDPLAETSFSLDSVAGVLKLYFRSLENPLFPIDSTSQLLEHSHIDDKAERAAHLKTVISSYPEPLTVVLRYLFAFLHHVSQYSDENMMQPYNLAVCFGPSLVRGAHDEDMVTLQAQINNLVKNLILQHESIFPSQAEVQGPVYEKCMTRELDDGDAITEEGDGEAENTHIKDDLETETLADQNTTSSFPAPTQRKDERPLANNRASPDQSNSRVISPGTNVAPFGKFMLTPYVAPQGKPCAQSLRAQSPRAQSPRAQSPSILWREAQDLSSSEVITVDKEVCLQMKSVFKEMLSKKAQQDNSSSPSFTPSLRKGKRRAV